MLYPIILAWSSLFLSACNTNPMPPSKNEQVLQEALPATSYWQQKVSYLMEIDLDVKTHRLDGKQTLTYYNNSPDTLKQVFYHLYFNAFQPNSSMDLRSRNIADPDRRIGARIKALNDQEIGYHEIQNFLQNGVPASFRVDGTIMKVNLAKPILPGDSCVFEMEFESQVPKQIRRSGRDNAEGISYTMTQWYPKMAEYDEDGWHPNPYVFREFYGVWGDFEVKLSIDSSYTLASTGYLQNPEEVGHGYSDKRQTQSAKNTWHFKAPQVHDFAWAADPDFIHTSTQVPNGPELHFFYQKEVRENWEKLPPRMVKAFTYLNKNFGQYPYPQFSYIQGGDGGMEYPMATMITGNRSMRSLQGVAVHEMIHNWFYGVLATNESRYPWMDEGFTTYATHLTVDHINGSSPLNPHVGSYQDYLELLVSGSQEPLGTQADRYNTNKAYSTAAYDMGCIFLHQLSYVIGQEALNRTMLRYFDTWKFRHPDPWDFLRVAEKESGLVLDWYLEEWVYTTHRIDYAIESVKPIEGGQGTRIRLTNRGTMPMPVDLLITKATGTELHNISLQMMHGTKGIEAGYDTWEIHPSWPWAQPSYVLDLALPFDQIESIQIDPLGRSADVNPQNNKFSPQ